MIQEKCEQIKFAWKKRGERWKILGTFTKISSKNLRRSPVLSVARGGRL